MNGLKDILKEREHSYVNGRLYEVFSPIHITWDNNVSVMPKKFYKQERDWTCALGAIRTMLSLVHDEVPTEEDLINKYGMIPGPYYSKELHDINFLSNEDIIFGFEHQDYTFDTLVKLMNKGYIFMIETCYNLTHWMVVIGVSANGDALNSQIVTYCPYYDEIKVFKVEELLSMWYGGSIRHPGYEIDFVGIKIK